MPPDPADVLLRKAQDDERLAILVVENTGVSDEQIGFLAQQAVEKSIKAGALAASSPLSANPRSGRVDRLADGQQHRVPGDIG